MQLDPNRSIRNSVSFLVSALLGAGAAAGTTDVPKIESSLLVYSESKRVTAVEGVISAEKAFSHHRTWGLSLTFDGLTGATPNGAAPSRAIQTFTGPSGRKNTVVQPGDTPLDNNFHDTRFALDGRLSQQLDRLTTAGIGAHFSHERDYASLGLNGSMTRDFFQKNTTLGVSAAYSHDVVNAIGGAPEPFSVLVNTPSTGEEGDQPNFPGKGKNVLDGIASLTQILDRHTLARVNFSVNRSTGYLTDPYKVLSVVQGSAEASPGDPVAYVHESRPDTRLKQAWFGELRRYIAGRTIDLSYRYFWDDWGITSNTVDATLRWPLKNDQWLQPHVRLYRQSQSKYYSPYLVDGNPNPSYASSDTRLASFKALTIGLQYSFPIAEEMRLSIAAEYYRQAGDKSPPDPVGLSRQFDLFPTLNTFMLRIGFSRGH
jgi:hypothetical protein